jgi:hypothetical protein
MGLPLRICKFSEKTFSKTSRTVRPGASASGHQT